MTHHQGIHPEYPEPDTSANDGKDGEPPPTWDVGKVTNPAPVVEEETPQPQPHPDPVFELESQTSAPDGDHL